MPAPTGLESITTGDPGASGEKIANISSQEDATIEIPGGFALSDRIADAPTVDRDNATADDTATTDMSTAGFAGTNGANLKAVYNRGAIAVWCTFEANTDSATIRLVMYDSADAPLFLSPAMTFTPLAQRLSASGHYMSEVQLCDSYGASQFRPYITAKGDATNDVDVYAHPI